MGGTKRLFVNGLCFACTQVLGDGSDSQKHGQDPEALPVYQLRLIRFKNRDVSPVNRIPAAAYRFI